MQLHELLDHETRLHLNAVIGETAATETRTRNESPDPDVVLHMNRDEFADHMRMRAELIAADVRSRYRGRNAALRDDKYREELDTEMRTKMVVWSIARDFHMLTTWLHLCREAAIGDREAPPLPKSLRHRHLGRA